MHEDKKSAQSRFSIHIWTAELPNQVKSEVFNDNLSV